jgi:hypothetical protein
MRKLFLSLFLAVASVPTAQGVTETVDVPNTGQSLIGVPATPLDPMKLPDLFSPPGIPESDPRPMDPEIEDLKRLLEIMPIETPSGSAQEDTADGPSPAGASFSTDFRGFDSGDGFPPDPNTAVGLDDVVVTVNSRFRIYDKLGDLGDTPREYTLRNWFSNVVPTTTFIFDPKVIYDSASDRFILIAMACNAAGCAATGTRQSWWLVSVSQTGRATGSWWNWALDARLDGATMTNNWADFPGLGLDNLAVYLTGNMYAFGGGFQRSKVRILNKSVLYTGGTVSWWDFWGMCNPTGVPSQCFSQPVIGCGIGGSNAFTLQPAHTYGTPGSESLINSHSGGGNLLTRWTLTNPLGTPNLACSNITVPAYSVPPDAVQQGGTTRLDTGDARLYSAVFRNGSLWTTHTTAVNWGDGINVAGARWYEIIPSSGAVRQAQTFGGPSLHYFYPAVVPDRFGNMVMVFSRSGATEFVSVRFAGRRSTDGLSTLRGSNLLVAGSANYVLLDSLGRNRWGDYFGAAWDPDTFIGDILWVYGEYARGVNTSGTWLGAFTFNW